MRVISSFFLIFAPVMIASHQLLTFRNIIMSRICVVTGSNKGIGYALVELLCKNKPSWTTYLTSRDEKRGMAAVKQLNEKGFKPEFHQLDIDNGSSVEKLRDFLVAKHGGLDVLVNNAGIIYPAQSAAPVSEQAKVVCQTNYFSLWKTCDILYPILRPHARVVIVSSRASNMVLTNLSSELKSKLTSADLTRDELDQLIKSFISSAEADSLDTDGWSTALGTTTTVYGASKIGATCMAFIQQREFNKDPGKDLAVNACCPGVTSTDLSGNVGVPASEGADTPYFLATLPEGPTVPRGGFLADREPVAWDEKPFVIPEKLVKALEEAMKRK